MKSNLVADLGSQTKLSSNFFFLPSLSVSDASALGRVHSHGGRVSLHRLKRLAGQTGRPNCGRGGKVWSPIQFYSVEYSQSRIGVKSALSTNAQSRFVSAVSDGVLGPPRLLWHT